MNKVALITGITGQDGAYLAEFLLNKGYTPKNLNGPGLQSLFRDEIHAMEFASIFGRDTMTPSRRFGFKSPRQLVKNGQKKSFGKKRFKQHLRSSPNGGVFHYGQGHGVVGGRSDEHLSLIHI